MTQIAQASSGIRAITSLSAGLVSWNGSDTFSAVDPATFAAASHTHNASDINAGTLDNARVNWASPSAIGSGTPAPAAFTTLTTTGLVSLGDGQNATWGSAISLQGADGGTYAQVDVISAGTKAVAFRVHPGGATSGITFLGEAISGWFEFWRNSAASDRFMLLAPTTVASGYKFVYVASSHNPITFGFSTSISVAPTDVLKINTTSLGLWGASSTANRQIGGWNLSFPTSTDASRKGRVVGVVYDTAEREAIRMEASGSAAMLGFFGVNAVVRPTALTAADGGAINSGDAGTDTVIGNIRTRLGEVETKLQALGLLT